MKERVENFMPVEAVKAANAAFPEVLPGAFKLTDIGNAERLVARYRDSIRYVPPWKRWSLWDGRRWAKDETGGIVRFAKATIRAIYGEAERCDVPEIRAAIAKHARESEKVGRLDAMIRLAQSEPGIAVTPDELDAAPMLLNVANGTIDLTTGMIGPHRREDLITRIVPVAFDAGARSELWERFLTDITGGDADLEAFLRRLAGYAATGSTTEKHFFFAHGPGDSGKSTFADAVRAALGDYAADADFDTWIEQTHSGGNRGDLARLVGARLVISVEVRRNAKFDTKTMKAITGGDPITVAAKYEAEFSYRPRFKLLLAANDAPTIRDDDAPLFERCLRIPFAFSVPAEKRDPTVKRRLSDPQDCGPAVLAWIVRGALEWRDKGLGIADAVRRSSAAYRSEMDRFGPFIEQCCAVEADAFVSKKTLRDSYTAWCEQEGPRPLGALEWTKRVQGIARDAKVGSSRGWRGLRLLRGDEQAFQQGHAEHVSPEVQLILSHERVSEKHVPVVPSDTDEDIEREAIQNERRGE